MLSRRLRVVEALAALLCVRLLLRLVPFRMLAARIGPVSAGDEISVSVVRPERQAAVAAVRAALRAAMRRLAWPDSCLIMALAGGFMLRRRGVTVVLHLGVARSATGFDGHAWLEAEGRMVCGEAGASRFTPVARLVSDRRPA